MKKTLLLLKKIDNKIEYLLVKSEKKKKRKEKAFSPVFFYLKKVHVG